MFMNRGSIDVLRETIRGQVKEIETLRQDVRKLIDALQAANRQPKPFFGSVPDAEGVITGRKSVVRIAEELEKKYASG